MSDVGEGRCSTTVSMRVGPPVGVMVSRHRTGDTAVVTFASGTTNVRLTGPLGDALEAFTEVADRLREWTEG